MRTADNPARLPPGMRDQRPVPDSDPVVEVSTDTATILTRTEPVLAADVDAALYGHDPDGEPQPSWEPIDTAPHDGRDVHIRYGEDDAQGRVVRWHNGRRFHNRRWQTGGRWLPVDDIAAPLPADEPTEWLRMEPPETEAAEPEAA